ATSSTLLTLALATLANISGPYDRAFEELSSAHLWLYFERGRVTRRDVDRIEHLPGVEASTGLRYSVVSRATIGDERAWVTLAAIPSAPPAVNRLLLLEGHNLAQRQEETLANTVWKDTHDLATGDRVTVTRAGGGEVVLPVAGLAYDPMWDWYASEQVPYLYVTEDTLRDLYPDEMAWSWALGLRLVDPGAVGETLAAVEDTLHGEGLETHADWRRMRESALFGVRMNLVFLGAFGLFASLATVLVIASSVGSIVLSQFRQIGVLKAVGFTPGQVLWLYLGQYLALSLVGGPVGLVLGMALSPLALRNMPASLGAGYRPAVEPGLILAVQGIVSATVLLAAAGAAWRAAQANIIRAIGVGAEAPRKRAPMLLRWATRLGLPPVLLLGLGDLYARPFRSLLTGVNLALGVMGIVFGLTINETVNRYREEPSLLGIAYDAVVTREEFGDGKTRHMLSMAPSVEAFYAEERLQVTTSAGDSFQVRAIDGDLAPFPVKVEEGRLLQPGAMEAIAGRGLLDWLGLRVGDRLTATLEGRENRPVTWQIVGQYPEPADVGRMLTVNLEPLRRLAPADPSVYYLKLRPGSDPSLLEQSLESGANADLNVALVEERIPDDVRYLQLAIYVLSAVLIGIALVNVFNSSLLAVREKVRDVGIYKTVGMTPGQVVAMVGTSAGLLGLVSAVVGIPVGLLLTTGLMDLLTASYGFGRVDVTVNALYLGLLVPAISLVSMAGSLLPGRWAAGCSIVHVLRSE
ncbi:MAG: ABC transporter permease, partial [Chloroflexi bacterium]